ncbi:MAG: hypothetical protein ACAF41_17375 [Leptolyngbya sp. BL-A-14]
MVARIPAIGCKRSIIICEPIAIETIEVFDVPVVVSDKSALNLDHSGADGKANPVFGTELAE